MNFFKELSNQKSFPVCLNLLPHYAEEGQKAGSLMSCVKETLRDGRIHTFFLSDQPVHPQELATAELAERILAAGGEPVVSISLAYNDRNRVLKKLQDYRRLGVCQFLFVSGDYPNGSDNRQAEPVFDLDSVQMLMLLNEPSSKSRTETFSESENANGKGFNPVKGCAVSPFKTLESEQIWQYEKLKRKKAVGADFFITPPGYDMRKFDELVRFCALHNISVPLVANILITAGEEHPFIKGTIPGVRMPERFLEVLDREAGEPLSAKGKKHTRAAKTLVVLKEMGYHGTLIGGRKPDFSEIKQVLDETEALQSHWHDYLAELDCSDSSFYYFQKNSVTGLNSGRSSPLKPKHFPSPLYSLSYFVDSMIYLPTGPFFKMAGSFCHFCNTNKFWYTSIWLLEFLSKGILYGCRMCGDCVLYACGFRCYQSECPKKMVNGPCGGSINGYCEVFPNKKLCFWVKVYRQMKGVSQHITFKAPPIPSRDNTLYKTSSWINFFLGRDHRKMHFRDE